MASLSNYSSESNFVKKKSIRTHIQTPLSEREMQRLIGIAPYMAPLNLPSIRLLQKLLEDNSPNLELFSITNREEISVRTEAFRHIFLLHRESIYEILEPCVGYNPPQLDTAWFRENFTLLSSPIRAHEEKYEPPTQTVHNWRKKHLVRDLAWDKPDPNSVAMMFLLYAMQGRQKFWYPACIQETEPYFWVFALKPGETSWTPCPIPVPKDIPPNTLLFSPWPGAGWLPSWWVVGDQFAMAWARTIAFGEQVLWGLTAAEIAQWDASLLQDLPDYTSSGISFSSLLQRERTMAQILHTRGEDLLQRLGKKLIAPYFAHGKKLWYPPEGQPAKLSLSSQ